MWCSKSSDTVFQKFVVNSLLAIQIMFLSDEQFTSCDYVESQKRS
jgi:hypothetical protein